VVGSVVQTDIMAPKSRHNAPPSTPGSGAVSSAGQGETDHIVTQPALPVKRDSQTSNNDSQLESQVGEPDAKRARTCDVKELGIVGGEPESQVGEPEAKRAKVAPKPCIPDGEAGKTTSTFKVVSEIIPWVWLSVTASARPF
jgi:hypothetical protein